MVSATQTVPLSEIINRVPRTRDELLTDCLPFKSWRLNNLYKIKNKQGIIVPFKLNFAQLKILECPHNRKVILKSRQVGVSTMHLIYNFDECVFYPNLNNGVMAQGLQEAAELLDKCRVAWEYLDKDIKRILKLDVLVNNSYEFGFNNGSKLMVRTSFRSGTLQNLHISELGKISVKDPTKAKELQTGTLQAIGGKRKVTIESTAEGKSGLFYEIWNRAENMKSQGLAFSELDFYPIFISWMEDKDCTLATPQSPTHADIEYFDKVEQDTGLVLNEGQRNFYIAKKRELGNAITQEYPSTPDEAFSAIRDGSYYAPHIRYLRENGRIKANIYDANLPVNVAMDLGYNDDFVLVFWQVYRGENRIIHCYSNHREDIEHYVSYMKGLGWKYDSIFAPHDIEVKELSTGISRRKHLMKLGVYVRIVKKHLVADGINAVRLMLRNCYIDESCVELINALENYSKEWDDKLGGWKEKPLHNQYSHIADAVRYMAMSSQVEFKTLEIDSFKRKSYSGNSYNKYKGTGFFDV